MKAKILTMGLIFLFLCTSVHSREKIKQSEVFLSRAVEFHGHLGPYLVLGLKAGLFANQILGKDPMKVIAFIKTKTTPPESCFVDGVQFSTGCTLGKGNISLKEGEGLVVTFQKNNQALTLKLKKAIINEMNSLPDQEEAWENLAKDIYERKAEEIFEIVNNRKD
jgi:formylmethanofuran dehydrogenase subunit E